MKNSLSHLPELKRAELAKIVAAIQENCDDVEKVILFGSYARGNFKEKKDLAQNRKSGHVSDYDILVVTREAATALDSALWQKISQACRNLNLSADPRILTHDIAELNNKLGVGQYFYSDVKKEGITLYDSNKFTLAEKRDLSEEERVKIAREHFEHWFSRAERFFKNYEFNFRDIGVDQDKSANGVSAFNLHQAAESAYKTVLLVLTNYNPNEHFLKLLGEEAAKLDQSFQNIFPQRTDEEKERFNLLEYAYIGGRYDPEYNISKDDLEILAKDVKRLLELVKRVCQ